MMEPQANILLTVTEINLILAGLEQMPYGKVNGLFNKILETAKAQLEAKDEPTAES